MLIKDYKWCFYFSGAALIYSLRLFGSLFAKSGDEEWKVVWKNDYGNREHTLKSIKMRVGRYFWT